MSHQVALFFFKSCSFIHNICTTHRPALTSEEHVFVHLDIGIERPWPRLLSWRPGPRRAGSPLATGECDVPSPYARDPRRHRRTAGSSSAYSCCSASSELYGLRRECISALCLGPRNSEQRDGNSASAQPALQYPRDHHDPGGLDDHPPHGPRAAAHARARARTCHHQHGASGAGGFELNSLRSVLLALVRPFVVCPISYSQLTGVCPGRVLVMWGVFVCVLLPCSFRDLEQVIQRLMIGTWTWICSSASRHSRRRRRRLRLRCVRLMRRSLRVDSQKLSCVLCVCRPRLLPAQASSFRPGGRAQVPALLRHLRPLRSPLNVRASPAPTCEAAASARARAPVLIPETFGGAPPGLLRGRGNFPDFPFKSPCKYGRSSHKCTSRNFGRPLERAAPPSARAFFRVVHAGWLVALASSASCEATGAAHAGLHARASVFFFGCFSSSAVIVLIERAKHWSLSCMHDVTSHFLSCILVAQLTGSLMTSACRAMRKRPGQTPCLSHRFSAVPLLQAVMSRSREQGMRLRRACTTPFRFSHTSLSCIGLVRALHRHAERWAWLTCQTRGFVDTESRAVFKAAALGIPRSGLKPPG